MRPCLEAYPRTGSWSVQGYDKPHYTNVIMPFVNTAFSA
jgi:hypothetical protein